LLPSTLPILAGTVDSGRQSVHRNQPVRLPANLESNGYDIVDVVIRHPTSIARYYAIQGPFQPPLVQGLSIVVGAVDDTRSWP